MESWRLGLVVALGCGCAVASAEVGVGAVEPSAAAPLVSDGGSAQAAPAGSSRIAGVVRATETGERIAGAIVVLQSTALEGIRETQTNGDGLYAFGDLAPGTYTVQVLYRQVDVAKTTTLPAGAKFRADFTIDPDSDGIVCRLPARRNPPLDESLLSVDANEARLRGLPRVRRGL
jgi:hypothetical protein